MFQNTATKFERKYQFINRIQLTGRKDIEDITRWREDINFMFSWQEQHLTSEHSERVRYSVLTREHKIHIFRRANVLFII